MIVKINRQLREYIDSYPPEWQKQVYEYLLYKRQHFDVKITTLAGTEFQQAVWWEIMKIPYGQIRSYSCLAAAIGRPKAFRAVANACGKNPYPIIIPCHRVVAASGIGGFSLEVELKKQLLKLESKSTNPVEKYLQLSYNRNVRVG